MVVDMMEAAEEEAAEGEAAVEEVAEVVAGVVEVKRGHSHASYLFSSNNNFNTFGRRRNLTLVSI